MFIQEFEVNGFKLGIGRVSNGMSIVLEFSYPEISRAIDNEDINLISAIKALKDRNREIDAIQIFDDNFEYYFERGEGWETALRRHSFWDLQEYKNTAELVLTSDLASNKAVNSAKVFLQALQGDYPIHIPSENSLRHTKQNRYVRQRSKWLKLLIEKNGYKCHICEIDKDLRIKHLVTIMDGGETELENLQLRCKKCINKK